MRQYGLIGNTLSHSFSQKHFINKFEKENIKDCSYNLFELKDIHQFPKFLSTHKNLNGLNVTIPYKESVIDFLTDIDENAKAIGAVNTLKFSENQNHIKGYNTDYYGFKKSLKPFLDIYHDRALIFGTGGAAKTVKHVLSELNIDCILVSRNPMNENEIAYSDLNKHVIKHHHLIINTTPIGMFPNSQKSPEFDYNLLTAKHFLYDLIYNPEETLFLKKAEEKGCITLNGLEMLKLQAEKSWEIWNT